MSRAIITESLLTGIADAIRAKLGGSDAYTPSEMATAIASIPTGGGGATNVVQGTFTGTTTGAAMAIDLGYTGNGYPIAAVVYPDGGFIENGDWWSTIQRYAVGMYAMTKSRMSQEPTYLASGTANEATVLTRYKSSTSSASTFSNGSSQTTNTFGSGNANASSTTCLRFKSDGTMSVYIASTSYGFMAGITYNYIVIYSS